MQVAAPGFEHYLFACPNPHGVRRAAWSSDNPNPLAQTNALK
jgi:hypothetical protein